MSKNHTAKLGTKKSTVKIRLCIGLKFGLLDSKFGVLDFQSDLLLFQCIRFRWIKHHQLVVYQFTQKTVCLQYPIFTPIFQME